MPDVPPSATGRPADDGVPSATPQRAKPPFREETEVDHLYETAAWRNRLRPAFLSLNPLCQLLEPDGRQCRRPAVEIHHIEAANEENFFDWSNLAGLCKPHHHKNPGDDAPRNYTPTIGRGGAIYRHDAKPHPFSTSLDDKGRIIGNERTPKALEPKASRYDDWFKALRTPDRR